MGKQDYCAGCDSNFYNGNNGLGIKKCWHLKSAKVVKRFRIGYWTMQDTARNFDEVKTLSCHTESGRAAFYSNIPQHLQTEWRQLKRQQRTAGRETTDG